MPFVNMTGNYQSSRYIVDQDGTTPFATIQSAIDQAVTDNLGMPVTIEIRPGALAYTENLVLVDGINLTGTADVMHDNILGNVQVEIDGLHTPPAAGKIILSNLKLTSATDILFDAGAGTATIGFHNCLFACNGFAANLALWTGDIVIESCSDISGANGLVSNTAGCAVDILESQVGATGASLTVNGVTRILNSSIFCPLLIGASAHVNIESSVIDALITILASGDVKIFNSHLESATTSVVFTDSIAPLYLANVVINCAVNPSIDGNGIVELAEVVFINDDNIAGTITIAQATHAYVSNIEVENNINLPHGQFVIQASSGTDGQIPIAATAGNLAWGSLTSTDGSVTFTTGANTLDLSSHAGDAWTAVAADGILVNNQAVYNTKLALLTMALPAVAPAGSYIKLAGTAVGAGGWIITTGLGQNIQCGANSAVTSVASSDDNDVISLVCVVANTTWQMVYSVGNLTIV